MQALTLWKTITMDHSNLLDQLISIFSEHRIRFCVIGGQAVNAYAEPVVSLDLGVVVASQHLGELESIFQQPFKVERFPNSLNISLPGSDLRVQIQTDPRYAHFLERAGLRSILGVELPVASLEDLLQGKVWAVQDPGRRPSKRLKDLADIARLLEAFPRLNVLVPEEILKQLT